MGELEEKINSILSSPQELDKITKLAQSILGESGDKKEAAESGGPFSLDGLLPDGMDAQALAKMISALSSQGESEKQAMLKAIKPHLAEKRRSKLDKAMQLAKLAKLAKLALSSQAEGGEDKDV